MIKSGANLIRSTEEAFCGTAALIYLTLALLASFHSKYNYATENGKYHGRRAYCAEQDFLSPVVSIHHGAAAMNSAMLSVNFPKNVSVQGTNKTLTTYGTHFLKELQFFVRPCQQ